MSSSFEFTRIPRSIDLANLPKNDSTRFSQDPCFGVNIYCLVMAVFVILVYPYIMKRYLARDDDKSAEEGIRTPGEMLHRFSRPALWARLSYLRLTHPMVGAYLIIVQEQAPREATCGLSCR